MRESGLGGRLWTALFTLALTLSAQTLPAGAQTASAAVGPLAPSEPVASERASQLFPGDVETYQRIFALQNDARWTEADRLIAALEDPLLLGHVLAQRYLHPTAYTSKFNELSEWLASYADHPQASRVYELAMRKKPGGAANLQQPIIAPGSLSAPPRAAIKPYRTDRQRSPAQRQRTATLKAQVKELAADGKLAKAVKLIESGEVQQLFDAVELDQAYAEVAQRAFFQGDDEQALALAEPAAERSGRYVPTAHWFAGLAAWRLEDFELAARQFEKVALNDRVNGWVASAGAYWAARAHLRRRDPAEMSYWLSLAAGYPRTFYGLLAREALGMKVEFEFRGLQVTEAGLTKLSAAPHGNRALALLQVGETKLAEQELLLLAGWDSDGLGEVLLAVADKADLAQFLFRLASRLADSDGKTRNGQPLLAALYPVPDWQPTGGFIVDRALIFALIRQESAFDPTAVSRAGARGLMQLMPTTASYVSGDPGLKGKRKNKLHDPALNLKLGQDYIVHLLGLSEVGGDLFRLAAAYNGGPGNLAKWQRETRFNDDPLLFIESIPYAETRKYIERVLANLWIYRARLGQPNLSLTEIANGDWPRYHPLDRR